MTSTNDSAAPASVPRLAVLIDADNTSPSWAEAIFEEVATLGEASVRRIYGDFSNQQLSGWNKKLENFAVLPHQQFAYTKGKNSSDITLVIDAMDLLHSGRFDGFVLVSSDSDFTRLASRIREEVDPDANIILGATFDQSLDGKIRVSVVATGLETPAQVVANTDSEKDKDITTLSERISALNAEQKQKPEGGQKPVQAKAPAAQPPAAAKGDDAKSQVWLLNRLGGEAEQLTTVKQGVSGFVWSPDKKRLLLLIKDAKPDEVGNDENGKASKKPRPIVVDRLQFKRDNAGYLDRRRTHLYVLDKDAKEPRQITSGDFDDSQPAWSPDGKLILTGGPEKNASALSNRWNVARVWDAETGELVRELEGHKHWVMNGSFSPDGERVVTATAAPPTMSAAMTASHGYRSSSRSSVTGPPAYSSTSHTSVAMVATTTRR